MPLPKSMIEAELPARAQQGDENALAALIARMMPAIRKGAADCTAPGLDFDDAVQEGLIGLFRAVREYDPAAGPTFAAFAAASIRHAQQDARRAALRKKHAPLNFSVPLPDAQQSTDTRPGPEEIAISGEQYADTMRRMQTELSELERRVLMAGLEGRPRRSWVCLPKMWPMPWPVPAASCVADKTPRIQVICLHHISTCPQ